MNWYVRMGKGLPNPHNGGMRPRTPPFHSPPLVGQGTPGAFVCAPRLPAAGRGLGGVGPWPRLPMGGGIPGYLESAPSPSPSWVWVVLAVRRWEKAWGPARAQRP